MGSEGLSIWRDPSQITGCGPGTDRASAGVVVIDRHQISVALLWMEKMYQFGQGSSVNCGTMVSQVRPTSVRRLSGTSCGWVDFLI